jgi:hypothetical protein
MKLNFGASFSRGKNWALILAKRGWATLWAIFFINSSGHPGRVIVMKQRSRAADKKIHNIEKATLC